MPAFVAIWVLRIGAFGLALALAAIPRAAAAARLITQSAGPAVATSSGPLRGTPMQNMLAYLGIPYAAPPVGPLRWQPPQPRKPWTAVWPATAFGPHCPQGLSPFGFPSASEDCLYLNVFAPAGTRADARLPVMVWFHGGGFTDGESDDYDPDRLVARGVIVVTVNYRLGYLGFLAASGLDAEPHTHVNYGLLDQQAALLWTHANIAKFGGDPERTTIFGQSAGGESVFAQLLAASSAGLFSRAIIESGAYGILSLPSLQSAETAGDAVAAALHCSPADTSCLRHAPLAQILALEGSSGSPLAGGPSPAVDGTFIRLPPEVALAAGAFNHVPIVQGSNHDEFRLFTALLFDLAGAPLSTTEYPAVVQQTLSDVGLGRFAATVLAHYPVARYTSPDLAYAALTTDAVFSTQAYLTDVLVASHTPLYAYEFSDASAPEDFLPPVSFAYGAAHGSELQFIYDSFDRVAPPLSPAETQLAAAMVRYWTDFARTARPDGCGAPRWPRYSGLLDDMQALAPPLPHPFFDFVGEHHVAFWAALDVAGQQPSASVARRPYLTLEAVRAAARSVRPLGRLY